MAATEEMTLVALSAAYGAAGSQIGPGLAQRLDVPFIDRGIALAVAERLDVSLADALAHEEPSASTLLERLLSGFLGADPGAPRPRHSSPGSPNPDWRGPCARAIRPEWVRAGSWGSETPSREGQLCIVEAGVGGFERTRAPLHCDGTSARRPSAPSSVRDGGWGCDAAACRSHFWTETGGAADGLRRPGTRCAGLVALLQTPSQLVSDP